MTDKVTWEYAHKHCHPETCSCKEDYRIRIGAYTVAWAETEKEAKEKVKTLKLQTAAKALLEHFKNWQDSGNVADDDISELFYNLEEALNEQSTPV